MIDHYYTIAQKSEGFYKEKGSKFLAFAYPVEDEEAIKSCLALLRKDYYDARHHCYAYQLGPGAEKFRANDDGEPNHSAGDPILGQIRSKGLTHVLVVVVRYFGGTKLGVSGLINAYKTAAEQALNQAEIVRTDIKKSVTLNFPYEATNDVMRLVNELEIEIVDQSFTDSCTINGRLKISLVDQLLDKTRLKPEIVVEIA